MLIVSDGWVRVIGSCGMVSSDMDGWWYCGSRVVKLRCGRDG